MSASRVELQIGELLLEGFERVDPAAVEAVVRRELQRLIAADGGGSVAGAGRSATLLDAGPVTLAARASAEEIGVEVARAVHRGIAAGGSS